MRISKIILIGLVLFLNCENSVKKAKKQRQFSNFPNGVLKHEVLLIDGKRQGVGLQYFDNGRVRSKAFYVDGRIEGESVVYHENGNIRQVNQNALDGTCLSKNYTEDGFLKRVVEIDSVDRISNYYSYKKDGSRDFRNETKNAIIISKNDTVNLGENYAAEIKLGNQQFKRHCPRKCVSVG